MSETRTYTDTYTITICADCGIRFGVPESYLARRRDDGDSFYCPNGHSLSYHETNLDRERKKRERAERLIESERSNARFWKERARSEERSKTAIKGHLTRRKKELRRVNAGICPCCNREFQNLKRHMKGQHPEYIENIRDSLVG